MSVTAIILGPFEPYRGGIAQYNSLLALNLEKSGWRVEKVEYYSYLWGQKKVKSKIGAETEAILSIWNPLSWVQTGVWIANQAPDVFILKYWTPLFVPMYWVISKIAKQTSKRVVIVDNVVPHEWFPFSRFLFKRLAA